MAEQKQSLYLRVQEKLSNVSTVNSYKELCKLLDEPDYSRPSKAAQLKKQEKEWKKCFTWRRKKEKYTSIKIVSPDEYYLAILKQLYQNSSIWAFFSFLNVYSQYTNNARLCVSKGDIALAVGLQNENYKDFHISSYSYGRRLEEYTLGLKDSKYPFVTTPKKEIREQRKKDDESAYGLTKRTQNLLDDYDSHTSKQNYYQVESMLNKLEEEGAILLHKTFVGGFIDKKALPFDADYSTIYEENGNFYLPVKNGEPLLVTYYERALTDEELANFLNLRGSIMVDLKCHGLSEVFISGQQDDFNKKLSKSQLIEFGALFIYPSYLINYSSDLVALNQSYYKTLMANFYNEQLLKKNLTANNKETQQKILKLKTERQSKEKGKCRNTFTKPDGTVIFSDKKEEEAVQLSQYYEAFLYEKLNKDLIQLNLDKLIPQNLESLSSNSTEKSSTWESLFNKSWTKIKNTENYQKNQIMVPDT